MNDGKVMLDRFKGAMLGCALGDAVGGVIEILNSVVVERVPGTQEVRPPYPSIDVELTSNSLTAIAVAQAIIELGRFYKVQGADKLARLYENSRRGLRRVRFMDEETEKACRALADGVDGEHSGVESEGCGAAARSFPVGLRYYDAPGELRDAALAMAGLTHRGGEAEAGAVAMAHAVSLNLLAEDGLDPGGYLAAVGASVERISAEMANRVTGLVGFLEEEPREAFEKLGSGSAAISAVPGALYSFMRTPDNFVATLAFAVNLGGVSAARGAMAGALSGARNGLSSIPPEMFDVFEGRDYIEDLAFRVFTLTPAAKPPLRRLV